MEAEAFATRAFDPEQPTKVKIFLNYQADNHCDKYWVDADTEPLEIKSN